MGSKPERPGLVARLLRFFGLRKEPPDTGVREPRRPVPSTSSGAVSLDLPESEDHS